MELLLQFEGDDAFLSAFDLSRDVPIETKITMMNTGVGLAWSYFYGYLDIILPGEPGSSHFMRAHPSRIPVPPITYCLHGCPEGGVKILGIFN